MPPLLPVSLSLRLTITCHNSASIQPENKKDEKLDATCMYSSKAEKDLNICNLTRR